MVSFPRSAGVHEERGMCREKRTRTWETRKFPEKDGKADRNNK